VAAQEGDPASLLNRVRTLIKLRHSRTALDADADFNVIYAESGKLPFVYTRVKDGQGVLVALNPAARPASVEIPGEVIPADPTALDVPGGASLTCTDGGWTLTLPPVSGAVYMISK
jgi:maltose alpha-D-glucosyltransferase/alpha-amylase